MTADTLTHVDRCPMCGDWRAEMHCGTCARAMERHLNRLQANLALSQIWARMNPAQKGTTNG